MAQKKPPIEIEISPELAQMLEDIATGKVSGLRAVFLSPQAADAMSVQGDRLSLTEDQWWRLQDRLEEALNREPK